MKISQVLGLVLVAQLSALQAIPLNTQEIERAERVERRDVNKSMVIYAAVGAAVIGAALIYVLNKNDKLPDMNSLKTCGNKLLSTFTFGWLGTKEAVAEATDKGLAEKLGDVVSTSIEAGKEALTSAKQVIGAAVTAGNEKLNDFVDQHEGVAPEVVAVASTGLEQVQAAASAGIQAVANTAKAATELVVGTAAATNPS